MSDQTVRVLVPDEVGERTLRLIDGLHVVRYQEAGDLLRSTTDAEVLIPGFKSCEDTPALLAQLPALRLVQLLSAGAERWLHRLPRGVQLSDCRGAHSAITAEWVLAGVLSILREFPVFLRNQDRGQWERHPSETLIGKRVLLIGAGHVANEVVTRLQAFDVAAIGRVARTGRPGVHPVEALPTLLPDHEIVVLLVPLTAATRHMVDRQFLAAMPAGAVLINASRGPVVDTDALLAALQDGRVRAVLDVTDPDPLPGDHPLWTAPGVLITPHVAGIDTRPAWRQRAYDVVRAQLSAVARGERPPNLVVNGY